jgi:ketosteroid isomerase-like protein
VAPLATFSSTAITSSAAPAAGVEAAITTLERDWAAAIVKKDVAALGRLLAEDFNGTSPTAHTFTKTVAIEDLKSGKYVVASMVLDEISVNVYGDVAVAFTSQKESSRYGSTDTSGHYHFTDVWVRKGGQWQVVASHGSRFNEGH